MTLLLSLLAPLLDAGVFSDPSWIMFGVAVAIGVLGLAALFLIYPFGRDD